MTDPRTIVQRLWNLCHVLRDDGITYQDYVTELTYLLFLKMAQETGTEDALPAGWRWADLASRQGRAQLDFYRAQLTRLGSHGSAQVRSIYDDARSSLRQPRSLARLVTELDALDWYSAREEGLGDLYEGLLAKNAHERKSGAGQYFTPRPLIDVMVQLVRPGPGEIISDPAAGTLGFLVRADAHIRAGTDGLRDLDEAAQRFQRREALRGVELVPDTRRLATMNALLHDVEADILLGDTLSPLGQDLAPSDVILTNPPFGSRRGAGAPTREDLAFPTGNKQLAFLQHIYRNLKPGGRAAVVLPDNVLFEDGVGQKVRSELMELCDLHTILRLPTGIFYAPGVKTNVLFFTRAQADRGQADRGQTERTWVYDLRTDMPPFGKRRPFTAAVLEGFVRVYGDDPRGKSARQDEGEAGRFRVFERAEIAARGDNLDITWLRGGAVERPEDLPAPGEIASQILDQLQEASEELQGLAQLLEGALDAGAEGGGQP